MTTPQDSPSEEEPHSLHAADQEASGTEEKNEDAKKELTPEEQMALYEESLKETDWGHQPC